MRVMQSELYLKLDTRELVECDELIQRGMGRDLLAAIQEVDLRTTQAVIASTIGKKKDHTDFLRGELERIRECARAAIAKVQP